MKKIQLTKGMEALVNDEDFEYLNQWLWCIHGEYAVRIGPRPKRERIKLHKEVAKRMGLIGQIDHEDRNKLNCQRNNLRRATQSQNMANRDLDSQNSSGLKGVHWHSRVGKWHAQIRLRGNKIHLGYFDSQIEAAKAYNRAAKTMFGEFAVLNPMEEE
jgi:hypothetical protein